MDENEVTPEGSIAEGSAADASSPDKQETAEQITAPAQIAPPAAVATPPAEEMTAPLQDASPAAVATPPAEVITDLEKHAARHYEKWIAEEQIDLLIENYPFLTLSSHRKRVLE